MSLPKEAIDQFKEIYLREFGLELSQNEATQRANDLFNLFKTLLKPKLDKRQENKSL